MLELRTAKMVMDTVNKGDGVHYGNILTIEDAQRMDEVKISTEGGYSIYAIQKGDMTILVWIHSSVQGIKVARVKFTCW